MKILKYFVLVAILVLAIASLAQADEVWIFSTTPDGPALGNSKTYFSSPGGVGLTATGFDSAGSGTALYEKFTTGDPVETGLGMVSGGTDHEVKRDYYIQFDVSALTAAGFTSLTLTVGSMQAGEGYAAFNDNTADTIPAIGTAVHTATGGNSDTFTYAISSANKYLDILATGTTSAADILIENGATAAVPVPPSALLMGSGLFGMGLLGWRRRLFGQA